MSIGALSIFAALTVFIPHISCVVLNLLIFLSTAQTVLLFSLIECYLSV